jgi:hypothetical protein
LTKLELQSAVVDISLVLNPVFITVAGTLQILITNKTEECFTDKLKCFLDTGSLDLLNLIVIGQEKKYLHFPLVVFVQKHRRACRVVVAKREEDKNKQMIIVIVLQLKIYEQRSR